ASSTARPTSSRATRSLPAGLSALVGFDGDRSAAENAAELEEYAEAVATGAVAAAARAFELDGEAVDVGAFVGLREREPVIAGDDFTDVAAVLVAHLLAEPRELLTLLAGRDAPSLEPLLERLRAEHPGLEIDAHDGGQTATLLLVAAE
ncbi:MAG: fatty acid kinase, partial [Gaiellaceae bacterium]|nr:fatty acid kinase [Gaiellaceae bacterium]